MKTKNFKKPIALFLAVMLCASLLFSLGTTAFAAEETANVCLIAFPRDGDVNYSGEWGHGNLNFMNGWSTKASAFTLIRAMGQYSGNICYCIEPGVSQQPGDSLTKKGEDFWDNYPAAYNKTISPEDIKLLIGRIFQYGYTGPISVSWRSQNDGGDKLAHAVATQLLIWETVVGERDADFNKIGTNGKDAIVDQISTNHPLYGQIMGYNISCIIDNQDSIPTKLIKSLLNSESVSRDEKLDLFAAIMPGLCVDDIQSILILLNLTDYLKIFDMRSRPKFEINNESEKLLAAFKECHLIDSYEESTTKAGYYKVARPKATKALSKEPSTVT